MGVVGLNFIMSMFVAVMLAATTGLAFAPPSTAPAGWTRHVSKGLKMALYAPPTWEFEDDPARPGAAPDIDRDALRIYTDPADMKMTGVIAIASPTESVKGADPATVVRDAIAVHRRRVDGKKVKLLSEGELTVAGHSVQFIEIRIESTEMAVRMLFGAFVRADRRYTVTFVAPASRYDAEKPDAMRVIAGIEFDAPKSAER
jgi:hypothetical protein